MDHSSDMINIILIPQWLTCRLFNYTDPDIQKWYCTVTRNVMPIAQLLFPCSTCDMGGCNLNPQRMNPQAQQ